MKIFTGNANTRFLLNTSINNSLFSVVRPYTNNASLIRLCMATIPRLNHWWTFIYVYLLTRLFINYFISLIHLVLKDENILKAVRI